LTPAKFRAALRLAQGRADLGLLGIPVARDKLLFNCCVLFDKKNILGYFKAFKIRVKATKTQNIPWLAQIISFSPSATSTLISSPMRE
jgi:hypothetical protein